MDVLSIIKADHELIRNKLKQLASATGVKVRRELLMSLSTDLDVHLSLEQDYLFPEVEGLLPDGDTLAAVGTAKISTIRRRAKALTRLVAQPAAEQGTFQKKVNELQKLIGEHFDAEERMIMPRLRAAVRTEEREDLGQVFIDVKEELAAMKNGQPHTGGSRPRARRRA